MSESTGWIDFKELRTSLHFNEVLSHYHVELKVRGEKATGFCPLPGHEGQKKSPSFSANLGRGIWQCFGCHAKGNVLDFACRMEGFNPDNPQELRKGALKIRELFLVGNQAPPRTEERPAVEKQESASAIINAPIDFELRTLDSEHPYLRERGFTDKTIGHFGLGYCSRGMLRGRVAIPLEDPQGRLVGYAGRITKDELVSPKCPKYLFPGARERDGTILEFRKSLLLYNAHRIEKPVEDLFVVEGFPSTWWLWQAEYRNTVALMGSDCSGAQAKLIVELVKANGRVWLMPDGDEAGVRCAESALKRLAPDRFVRWVRLEPNEQPTDLTSDELVGVIEM